ncbi:hypothetical protein JNM87_01905 [Candidatus Saccharibacteria bacterium]|nr:hypothetical protein [Candidatus Saccharibacteria bacterium]
MEIIILLVVFGLAILPVALFRYFRRNKDTKTKEERRAESIAALIIILFIALLVFVKQSVMNDRKDDILHESYSTQSTR